MIVGCGTWSEAVSIPGSLAVTRVVESSFARVQDRPESHWIPLAVPFPSGSLECRWRRDGWRKGRDGDGNSKIRDVDHRLIDPGGTRTTRTRDKVERGGEREISMSLFPRTAEPGNCGPALPAISAQHHWRRFGLLWANSVTCRTMEHQPRRKKDNDKLRFP